MTYTLFVRANEMVYDYDQLNIFKGRQTILYVYLYTCDYENEQLQGNLKLINAKWFLKY